MPETNLTILTGSLSKEQKLQLAVPLAQAYMAAMKNVGLDELRSVAGDQVKSTVIGYMGFAGKIYEIANSVYEDGIGETLKGNLTDYFLEFTGLEHFKTAYEVLEKLDNGRSALGLAKDIHFKKVIGKFD
jgi:hypothetical protein